MADTTPNPTWWMDKPKGTTPETYDQIPTQTWHFDQIIAGNNPVLTETTFYIWNNKGVTDPAQARHRMTECKVTTLDDSYGPYSAGGHDSPLVKEGWVYLDCEKTREVWKKIGGKYGGDGNWTQDFATIGAIGSRDPGIPKAGDKEILGRANDGTFIPDSQLTNDGNRDNYAKFKCRIAVPEHAIAGQVKFLLRCYYNIAAGNY